MHTKKVLQEEEGYSTPTTLCVQISKVFRTQWGGICTQNRKEGGNDIGVCGSWIQNGNCPCLYVHATLPLQIITWTTACKYLHCAPTKPQRCLWQQLLDLLKTCTLQLHLKVVYRMGLLYATHNIHWNFSSSLRNRRGKIPSLHLINAYL